MQTEVINKERRNFLQKVLFRFGAVYFFIYIFPFPLYYLPLVNIISTGYSHLIYALVMWTGKYVFHVVLPAHLRGDISDGVYQYIQFFVQIVIAILLVSIWSFTGRIKKYDEPILYWVSVYVRYRFALSMLKYGFEKIQRVQFSFPYSSLTETYGESSPMRLLWNFMGYSTPYNIFIGILEAGTGFLLLFRRTKLLGALLSITVLSNVVLLNFCYDVPVKMHSVTLLLMAVFLAAPDAKRLADFFLNKAIPAAGAQPRYNKPWMKALFSITTLAIIAYTVYIKAGPIWRQYTTNHKSGIQQIPLYGIYTVEQFVRNHDTMPGTGTDTGQWKILSIFRPKQATIKMADNNFRSYHFYVDTLNRSIQVYENHDSVHQATLLYEMPDSVHLIVSGKLKGDSVNIEMRKQDMNRYELLNRGFHWINEYPYNK